MRYERFEELPVWKAAIELAVGIDRLVQDRELRSKGDLANQLERAALSISSNIAEGFERGTTAELIYFLYVDRGSAGEVRSALHVTRRLGTLARVSSQIDPLIAACEGISRQLRGWAQSLQDSDIKGQRFLTEKVKNEWDQARRSAAFWDKIQGMTEAARGARENQVRDQRLDQGGESQI